MSAENKMNISEKKLSELNKLELEAEISFNNLIEKLSEKYSHIEEGAE